MQTVNAIHTIERLANSLRSQRAPLVSFSCPARGRDEWVRSRQSVLKIKAIWVRLVSGSFEESGCGEGSWQVVKERWRSPLARFSGPATVALRLSRVILG
jgi:hypothetical protein